MADDVHHVNRKNVVDSPTGRGHASDMRTIWKYPVPASRRGAVEMPKGAKILTVQMQGDDVCMWAMVDPAAPLERRQFLVVGTGHDIPGADALTYLGTFQPDEGGSPLVFHVFEVAL
jgi:hypothetical protein